jgi:signal transduction histidine kinase
MTRALVYLAALHALLALLGWLALHRMPLWLFACEALLALSAWFGVRLVRGFVVPLDLLRTGAELIGERDFTSSFVPTGQPEMDALIAVYNRMVGQLREERLRLAEHHQFLDRVLAASPTGVVTLDFDGKVSAMNPSAERWLAATLATPATPAMLATPGGLATPTATPLLEIGALGAALAAIPAGEARVLPLPGGRRLKATRAELFDRGFRRGFFLLEELTAELRASEKAAYGKLIRMMSHEVNNSVGAVGSLLDSFRSYAGDLGDADRDELLTAIGVAVTRLDNLRAFTNGFAEVVRLPPPELRLTDPRRLLDELLLLLRPELERRRIRCVWTAPSPQGAPAPATARQAASIPMDRNQIEQVLVNVLRNAIEAIGEDGTITLSLADEGARTVLTVADSGAGIAPGARPLLFTPFFSTKRDGRGLGLILIQDILAQHGFAFSLDDAPGGGAIFRLVLQAP